MPDFQRLDQLKSFYYDKKLIHLAAGFRVQVADSLWLRSLQGFDVCKSKVDECDNSYSWLFRVLDMASDFDPRIAVGMYQSGALGLSIIVSDIPGATIIFNKAVEAYPNDWKLLYSAAYQSYFEEKNLKKAADLYARAAQNGAPDWVGVMAGRLAAEGGDFDYAKKVLQTMIDTNQDEKLIKRLQEKIDSLEKSNN